MSVVSTLFTGVMVLDLIMVDDFASSVLEIFSLCAGVVRVDSKVRSLVCLFRVVRGCCSVVSSEGMYAKSVVIASFAEVTILDFVVVNVSSTLEVGLCANVVRACSEVVPFEMYNEYYSWICSISIYMNNCKAIYLLFPANKTHNMYSVHIFYLYLW